MKKCLMLVAVVPVLLWAQSLSGLFDATVESGGVTVPFQMEFKQTGNVVEATFLNAGERNPSTAGKIENGKLSVEFAHMGARLDATVANGRIDGIFTGSRKTGKLPFHARMAQPKAAVPEKAPNIDGEWEVPIATGKGEKAWRLLVRQNGSDVKAGILRVDGDTGELSGSYRDGKFTISHFSGARANLMVLDLKADGSLHMLKNGTTEYTAWRPAAAREKGLPAPTNPELHTEVKNPNERFQFSFKDLNGKTVSNNDPRFEGKVMLISMTGSWCPNCHDEAPFLAALYKKYRAMGLEMVGLSFEEEEQLADPVRLRAFVKSYGIEYPMLVCGIPDDASAKMPQLQNFNAWPTTIFVGRDGKVRKIHAGFPSGASGKVYEQTKAEIEKTVVGMLAEKAR
jgi:thiol-disulfide isomerase/thioredoxin